MKEVDLIPAPGKTPREGSSLLPLDGSEAARRLPLSSVQGIIRGHVGGTTVGVDGREEEEKWVPESASIRRWARPILGNPQDPFGFLPLLGRRPQHRLETVESAVVAG